MMHDWVGHLTRRGKVEFSAISVVAFW